MITVTTGKKNLPKNYQVLDADLMQAGEIIEAIMTPDLFSEKKTYLVKNIDASAERKDQFIEALKSLVDTPHQIIVLFEKLLVADKKKIPKGIELVEEKVVSKKVSEYNPFELANQFIKGDVKKTWTTYHKILKDDPEPEKLLGMIWWKIKDEITKKGVTPERREQAKKLLMLYHESRTSGLDLADRLELFFLNK